MGKPDYPLERPYKAYTLPSPEECRGTHYAILHKDGHLIFERVYYVFTDGFGATSVVEMWGKPRLDKIR